MDGTIVAVSMEDTIQVIKELGGLVAGITAMLIAWTALRKSGRADTRSQVSDAKSDVANERISNVAKFQDTMRSDLTNVANNSVPATILNVKPTDGASPSDNKGASNG